MQQMLASGGNMGEKSPVIPKEWHGKKATALDRAKIAYLPPRERPDGASSCCIDSPVRTADRADVPKKFARL